MADNERIVNVRVEVIDQMTQQLAKIRQKAKQNLDGIQNNAGQTKSAFQGVSASVQNFAARFAPAALATVALTTAFFALKKSISETSKVAKEFESTMSKLKAIVKPTSIEFKLLEKRARELGSATIFTAAQAGEAFVEMGKLGLEANEIIDASAGVLNLAAIAQTGMAESATVVTQTLNQFGLEAGESNRIVDVMAKSFSTSALDMNKFSEAMKFAGVIAKGTGVSVETTTAALAVLADQGIEASMAGTGLRFTLGQLAQTSSKAGKMLGITSDDTRTMVERLRDLGKLGLTSGQFLEIFGQRAAGVAEILSKNVDSLKDFDQSLQDAKGSGDEMAKTMQDNLEGASIRLDSAINDLAISIGSRMNPAIKLWKEGVTILIGEMKGFFSDLEDGGKLIAAMGDKELTLTSTLIRTAKAAKDASIVESELTKKRRALFEANNDLELFKLSDVYKLDIEMGRTAEKATESYTKKIEKLKSQMGLLKGALLEIKKVPPIIPTGETGEAELPKPEDDPTLEQIQKVEKLKQDLKDENEAITIQAIREASQREQAELDLENKKKIRKIKDFVEEEKITRKQGNTVISLLNKNHRDSSFEIAAAGRETEMQEFLKHQQNLRNAQQNAFTEQQTSFNEFIELNVALMQDQDAQDLARIALAEEEKMNEVKWWRDQNILTEQETQETITAIQQDAANKRNQIEIRNMKLRANMHSSISQGIIALDQAITTAMGKEDKKRSAIMATMAFVEGLAASVSMTKSIASDKTMNVYQKIGMSIGEAARLITLGAVTAKKIREAKFEGGGIVQGSRFPADTVNAKVTGGEMILNASQQSRLFNIAAGKAKVSGTTLNIGGDTMIFNGAVDDTTVESLRKTREDQLEDLREMMDELEFAGQI